MPRLGVPEVIEVTGGKETVAPIDNSSETVSSVKGIRFHSGIRLGVGKDGLVGTADQNDVVGNLYVVDDPRLLDGRDAVPSGDGEGIYLVIITQNHQIEDVIGKIFHAQIEGDSHGNLVTVPATYIFQGAEVLGVQSSQVPTKVSGMSRIRL